MTMEENAHDVLDKKELDAILERRGLPVNNRDSREQERKLP